VYIPIINFTCIYLSGGTSNLNFMVYMRGHPKDFDHWANLTGDKGWEYKNLIPYWKKMEDYHGNYPNGKLLSQKF